MPKFKKGTTVMLDPALPLDTREWRHGGSGWCYPHEWLVNKRGQLGKITYNLGKGIVRFVFEGAGQERHEIRMAEDWLINPEPITNEDFIKKFK